MSCCSCFGSLSVGCPARTACGDRISLTAKLGVGSNEVPVSELGDLRRWCCPNTGKRRLAGRARFWSLGDKLLRLRGGAGCGAWVGVGCVAEEADEVEDAEESLLAVASWASSRSPMLSIPVRFICR